MLNTNNLKELAYNLEDIIETPVSSKLLEFTTEKQRNWLGAMINNWSYGKITKSELEGYIKSVLDYANNKVKRYHRPSTELYLKNKNII